MVLLECRTVRAGLRECGVGRFVMMKMGLLRLIDESSFMLFGFIIGMLRVINRIISVGIRQRRRHTSALLELYSPGRLATLMKGGSKRVTQRRPRNRRRSKDDVFFALNMSQNCGQPRSRMSELYFQVPSQEKRESRQWPKLLLLTDQAVFPVWFNVRTARYAQAIRKVRALGWVKLSVRGHQMQ